MAPGAPGIVEWLLSAESRELDPLSFCEGLVGQLVGEGIPIWRFASSVLNMHPEVFVQTLRWTPETGAQIGETPYSVMGTPGYVGSPVEAIYRGSPAIRVRMADGPLPYPQLAELCERGMTDYFIAPLPFSGGRRSYASIATRAPAGFSDVQLRQFEGILPALSLRLEVMSGRYAAASLLRVYLGEQAAARVLSGQFLRGTGQAIDAAIAFFDMRGFSSFSDLAPMRQVVETLDTYFEALAGPIAAHGGEILKFIGDAVLAVFPLGADPQRACASAIDSATEGIRAVEALGDRLVAEGGHLVRAGAGVHVGSMLYGNIGAKGRLDFTVIGPAVNEAARIGALCKELGQPVLVSRECAQRAARGLISVGLHPLRGIRGTKELFTPG